MGATLPTVQTKPHVHSKEGQIMNRTVEIDDWLANQMYMTSTGQETLTKYIHATSSSTDHIDFHNSLPVWAKCRSPQHDDIDKTRSIWKRKRKRKSKISKASTTIPGKLTAPHLSTFCSKNTSTDVVDFVSSHHHSFERGWDQILVTKDKLGSESVTGLATELTLLPCALLNCTTCHSYIGRDSQQAHVEIWRGVSKTRHSGIDPGTVMGFSNWQHRMVKLILSILRAGAASKAY